MTALPTRTDISGTPSKATAQAAFTAMYDYLAGLFGSTGAVAAARDSLGIGNINFRNRVINGDCTIDQMNVGAAYTIVAGAARQPVIDMFYANCTGANCTAQQIAAVDTTKRFRYTGAASVTGIFHDAAISAVNSRDLAGKACTFSVKLANSLLTTVTWTAYYANTNEAFGTIAAPTRTQISTGTFTTVNATEATYVAPIAVPAAATTGLEIVLSVGAQTSGTWTVGDEQLELGTIPSGAIVVDKVDEEVQLARCQREYEVGSSGAVGGSSTSIAISSSATFAAQKRSPTPAITFSGTTYSSTSSITLGSVTKYGVVSYVIGTNGTLTNSSFLTTWQAAARMMA
jgi:hypothetical protein